MDARESKRLDSLKGLLADIHARLGLKFGFRLWDGSHIPAEWPESGLVIRLADAGVVASLLRRPKLDTLLQLHVSGRLDWRNGTLFDIAAARPEGKVGRLLRQVPKRKILDLIRHHLFGPTGPSTAALSARGDETARDGTRETNKTNIAYHYDVSNEFYRLFLDEQMVYTCAYFTHDHWDLEQAQRDKLDMICRKLRLQPGDRLLDIGCGWGALLCHAAEHYGVEAHGVTLAEEQVALARERIRQRGLEDRVTVHLKNFNEMEGTFDKIASIGMFEHVGLDNHAEYFRTVHRLLRPRGLYLHHTIARRAKKTDRAFRKMPAEYRALVRYIFPGGELDHLGMSITNLERHGFEVHDVEGWREHYERTCKLWFERLEKNRDAAVAEVGEEKVRMWSLYLAGCSLAFGRGGAMINQTLVSRRTRGPSGLPWSRADLYKS